MSRIRTIFLGTPDIARHCLECLIKDEHYEVVGVVTQPDRPRGRHLKLQPSPVKELVTPLGIDVLTPENVNHSEVLAHIASWRAEVAVVVAFGQILSQEFLDLHPRLVVNVHASLLPRWRGAAPIQRALMAGDEETGVCLQVMVKKLDAGDVLGSRRLKLDPEWNALEVLERMKPLACDLLKLDLMDYLRGNLSTLPQDESLVTYAHKIEKSESPIQWNLSAREIHNHVRGMTMGPGATAQRASEILKIHRTRVREDSGAHGQPGEVVGQAAQGLWVACGQGLLELVEVQPPSRSRMPATEYMKGYPFKNGEVLS